MTVYLDTSALAKWYVAEAGSEAFAAFIAAGPDAVTSRLTLVEMRCLLARRRRAGAFPAAIEALAWQRVTEQMAAGHVRVEAVPDARFAEALRLTERLAELPLRTLDALHLAAAQAADVDALATGDLVMRRAAEALGIEVAFFGAETG